MRYVSLCYRDRSQLILTIGKSSITLRLVRSQWTSDYDPTIEDSYSVTRAVDGLNYHLSLTDTAGQEEYRSLWAASNLQSDAFLLVYDITNHHSLDGLSWFLDMIDIEAESRMEENHRLLREKGNRVRGNRDAGWRVPPIKIIAGNKCDLKEAKVVSSKTGLDWAKSKDCGFMETSARDMVNIEETFACESTHGLIRCSDTDIMQGLYEELLKHGDRRILVRQTTHKVIFQNIATEQHTLGSFR